MKKLNAHSLTLFFAVATLLQIPSRTLAAPSSPAKLNGPFRGDADVEDYEISSDSKWVVYRADQDTNGVRELFLRPVAGSDSARKLNPPLVKGGNVEAYAISPDGAWVAFWPMRGLTNSQSFISVV